MSDRLATHEVLVIVFYTAFWIWMMVDCWRREPKRVRWLLILILVPLGFGVAAYVVRKMRRDRREDR